jgi:UDP-galactopyranose mutase
MHIKNLIIGGGPAGLSAAYHLGSDYLVLEKESDIGGLCRSVNDSGFVFDYAGHILFTNEAYVRDVLYPMLLDENIHWQDREAWIFSKNVFTRYPFQAGTYGLPVDVIKDCIMGAIEAVINRQSDQAAKNFEAFILQNWGTGIAKHFMLPYNRKLWTIPLAEMSHTWLAGRVPTPALAEIVEGALRPQPKPMGPNARFGYPIRGGFNALVDGWKKHLDNRSVLCGVRVDQIDTNRHSVRLNNGTHLGYERLIVTAPLPTVVDLVRNCPGDVRAAREKLRWISVRCVNFGINRPKATDKHWIYYPEDTVFHRLFIQSNASEACAPPGCTGITAEITYSASKPLPADGQQLIERVIDDACRVGIVRRDDRVLMANQVDLPFAYVVPEIHTSKNVETIRTWLAQHDIHLAGRFAEWAYYNSDHAMMAGKRVAEFLLSQDGHTLRLGNRRVDDSESASTTSPRALAASERA